MRFARRYNGEHRLAAIRVVADYRANGMAGSYGDLVDEIAHALGLWQFYSDRGERGGET